jgi:hypothetical protein
MVRATGVIATYSILVGQALGCAPESRVSRVGAGTGGTGPNVMAAGGNGGTSGRAGSSGNIDGGLARGGDGNVSRGGESGDGGRVGEAGAPSSTAGAASAGEAGRDGDPEFKPGCDCTRASGDEWYDYSCTMDLDAFFENGPVPECAAGSKIERMVCEDGTRLYVHRGGGGLDWSTTHVYDEDGAPLWGYSSGWVASTCVVDPAAYFATISAGTPTIAECSGRCDLCRPPDVAAGPDDAPRCDACTKSLGEAGASGASGATGEGGATGTCPPGL